MPSTYTTPICCLSISLPNSPTYYHLHPPSPTVASSTQSLPLTIDDGLTIPFVLIASLSGANATSFIILTIDVAEAANDAISMGLEGAKNGKMKRAAEGTIA